MSTADDIILAIKPLGFPWETLDPFLFCAYHDDHYPAGDGRMGPAASLAGREIGMDFAGKDGWRMYHGQTVPGFPQHPHRGFETVTVARQGLIDHSDSLGATARYGAGDVQWLTAGKGIVHAEMFPLINGGQPNPLELFQIWLNLPARDKMVDPYFSMLWNPVVPRHAHTDDDGRQTRVTVVAGALGPTAPLAAPPNSWAARAESDVAIWTIKMDPGARFTLPAAIRGSNRVVYFFRGAALKVGERDIAPRHSVRLRANAAVTLQAGSDGAELLLLQGRPIGEPVVQYGPFVMNTPAEIQRAFADYQRTQFGGWPWPKDEPVHALEDGRFAQHADGRVARAPG
ncbi:MAG TPA: pirin family protein [Polyangia bacterium]|nr:pirin family protein [Polyangia bacterium]